MGGERNVNGNVRCLRYLRNQSRNSGERIRNCCVGGMRFVGRCVVGGVSEECLRS